MKASFIRRGHTNHLRLNNNPEACAIFQKVGWLKIFNKFNGYNDQESLEFAQSVELVSKQEKYKHDSNALEFYT